MPNKKLAAGTTAAAAASGLLCVSGSLVALAGAPDALSAAPVAAAPVAPAQTPSVPAGQKTPAAHRAAAATTAGKNRAGAAVPVPTVRPAGTPVLLHVAATDPVAVPVLRLAPTATGGRTGTVGVGGTGAPVRPAGAAAKPEKRVSLDFVAADINDVLKALALQAGVNIVAATDVKGSVTVSLQRVSVPEALDMVARLSGFQYARLGPAYVVGTAKSVAELAGTGETKATVARVTAMIPYRFVRTADLSKALAARFPDVETVPLLPNSSPENAMKRTGVTKTVDAYGRTQYREDYEASANGASSATAQPISAAPRPAPEEVMRTGTLGDDDQKADGKAQPWRPRVLVVTGTPVRIEAVRDFVAELEGAFQFPVQGASTEVYRVRYAAPGDLTAILAQLVPTIQVQLGPTQGFQSGSSGASASYAAGPGEGGGASAGGDTSSGRNSATSSGGGPTSPAGALASGNAPTTLLLTGAPADLVRARQVLDQVDVRAPQMVFEARVMDVSNDAFSQIGLTYDFSRGISVGEPDAGPASIQGVGARRPNFGAILRTPYSIGVNLDLLQRNGRARILANPNISALDGQPAVVFIGDQIKYVIRQEVTPTGTNIQTETATVGITLKVTGKSSPDGTITLYVHPEVSTVSGYLSLNNGISLPQIATRYVDTTIRVKDGETIALGGLVRETDISSLQKVPFLGDLPFFGQLFRRSEKTRSRSEVVVFITSRILKD